MKTEDAAGREHIPFIVRTLGLAAGRSAFVERVFDYLEPGPWLLIGERLLRMQLKTVRVHHQIFGTDVEITFTLNESGSAPAGCVSKSPSELADEPKPKRGRVTIRFKEQVTGDQIFHFTFTSRQDFEISLIELEGAVEALYQSSEEKRALDQFFYDHLSSFMQSDEEGRVSEKPLTLPPPARPPRIELERIRLRHLLRQLLFYHHYSFLSTRRKDRAISVLLIILPVLIGIFVSLRDVSGASARLFVALASVGVAVIAGVRVVFNLPALAEEHRHFSIRCRELLRDLEQVTRGTSSGTTPKELELKLARITLQAQDLSALSPGNFRRP
jgi:hypothetical protein